MTNNNNSNQDKKNIIIRRPKMDERHATWLELFYDLVFEVIVSQLSYPARLAKN